MDVLQAAQIIDGTTASPSKSVHGQCSPMTLACLQSESNMKSEEKPQGGLSAVWEYLQLFEISITMPGLPLLSQGKVKEGSFQCNIRLEALHRNGRVFSPPRHL